MLTPIEVKGANQVIDHGSNNTGQINISLREGRNAVQTLRCNPVLSMSIIT